MIANEYTILVRDLDASEVKLMTRDQFDKQYPLTREYTKRVKRTTHQGVDEEYVFSTDLRKVETMVRIMEGTIVERLI